MDKYIREQLDYTTGITEKEYADNEISKALDDMIAKYEDLLGDYKNLQEEYQDYKDYVSDSCVYRW